MTEAQSDPSVTEADNGEVSEDDLQAKQAHIEELRLAVAQAQSDLAGRQASVQRQIDMAQLDGEQARLEVMLAQAKVASSPETVTASARGPLAQAKAVLEAAQAQAKATIGPVDTNAGVSDEQVSANALPTAESVAAENAAVEEDRQAAVDELVNAPVEQPAQPNQPDQPTHPDDAPTNTTGA